jgi:hypothetical protein
MQEQDKYKTQYFLQMHDHIICLYGGTTSYTGRETTFFHFYTHNNYNLFKAIYQEIKK